MRFSLDIRDDGFIFNGRFIKYWEYFYAPILNNLSEYEYWQLESILEVNDLLIDHDNNGYYRIFREEEY